MWIMGSLENMGTQLIEECTINIGIHQQCFHPNGLACGGESCRNVEMKEIIEQKVAERKPNM